MLEKLKQQIITWYREYKAKQLAKLREKLLAVIKEQLEAKWSDLTDTAQAIVNGLINNLINRLRTDGIVANVALPTTSDVSIPLTIGLINSALELMKIVGIQPVDHSVGTVFHMVPTERENRRALEVIRRSVEVSPSYLQVNWTKDPDSGLPNVYLHDMKTQVESTLITGATIGLVTKVVGELKQLAVVNNNVSQVDRNSTPQTLAVAIVTAANAIGFKTSRGPGNFAIVSELTLERLMQLEGSSFVSTSPALERTNELVLRHVGTLNAIAIYVLAGSGASLPLNTDEVLVGFKGMGEIDAGYVLSPQAAYVVASGSSSVKCALIVGSTDQATTIAGATFDPSNYYHLLTLN